MKIITILLLVFSFCSCAEKPKDPMDKLFDTWVLSKQKNRFYLYGKIEPTSRNPFFIRFYTNGDFIKRDYNNWCTTGNNDFENYKGSWILNPDSTITTQYKNYLLTIEEDWTISALSEEVLKLKLLDRRTEKLYSNR